MNEILKAIQEKNIILKNYYCSRNGIHYENRFIPRINLYIQSTSKCNAKCYFCNTRCKNDNFNFKKLEKTLEKLKELCDNDVLTLGKIAITGGEPLLNMGRTKEIIRLCKLYFPNTILALNTNAYDLKRLKEIYFDVDEVHISKHHYDNKINDEIMRISTPSIEDIYDEHLNKIVKINCVWQKGYMETNKDLENMLELLGKFQIKEIRNISLLPLTQKAQTSFVDLKPIMEESKKYLNDGYLYDKNMCECFEFSYLCQNGFIVKSYIRNTINDNYSCLKQFVFDGEYLYDGFKKNNILF